MDTKRPAVAAPVLDLTEAVSPASQRRPAGVAWAMVVRCLSVAWRRPADAAASAGFYVLVASLVALASAPSGAPRELLAAIAAWIGAVLATLLAQQHGMQDDAASGLLDQVRMAPAGGPVGAATGMLAGQVIVTAAPLALATPLVALFFGLDGAHTWALLVALLTGLPAVVALTAFAAALTVSSRATPAVQGLLVLPLAVPVLLFGVRASQPHNDAGASLLLAACSLAAMALGPFALAAAISLEDDA